MKRAIFFISFLVAFAGLVSAGSVEDLDVEYKDRCLFWDKTRSTEVDDSDVFIDADLLGGEDLLNYVHDRESSWSKDEKGGGGMSPRDLWRYLTGSRDLYSEFETFVDYLLGIFSTKSELESVHERVDKLEATINVMHPDISLNEQDMIELLAGLKKARRTGQTQHVNGYQCDPNVGACVKME